MHGRPACTHHCVHGSTLMWRGDQRRSKTSQASGYCSQTSLLVLAAVPGMQSGHQSEVVSERLVMAGISRCQSRLRPAAAECHPFACSSPACTQRAEVLYSRDGPFQDIGLTCRGLSPSWLAGGLSAGCRSACSLCPHWLCTSRLSACRSERTID